MKLAKPIAARRIVPVVSAFSFTGLVRYFASLFCYYRYYFYFYGKTAPDRSNRLLTTA